MQIKFNRCVCVRHVDDESLVFAPRTMGLTLFSGASAILNSITSEWQNERDIIDRLLENECCDRRQVEEAYSEISTELLAQGFVLRRECEQNGSDGGKFNEATNNDDNRSIIESENVNLFDEFCAKHDIIRELHLDLTDACTEKCVHCYVPRNGIHHLSFDSIKKVLHEFRSQNGFTVYLSGGECMLHPEFDRICGLCRSLNINLIIFSNLTCCNARRISFLREIDPQFINVSLYSMNPKEHDTITRLKGSWKRTMNALLACEMAGVHCRISAPLLKINRHSFTELRQFADAHHMHLISTVDIIARSDHDCKNLECTCTVEEMRCVMQSESELFDRYSDVTMPPIDAKVCDIGVGRMYLNAQGMYYPCDGMHNYVLGSVDKNSILEIWHGEKLEYLRGLKNQSFGSCATCKHRPWCKVCPASNYNATRSLFIPPEGRCEVAKMMHDIFGRDIKCF